MRPNRRGRGGREISTSQRTDGNDGDAAGEAHLRDEFSGAAPPAVLRALEPGEWVIARTGLHWSIYVPAVAVSWLWGGLLVWAGVSQLLLVVTLAATVELLFVPVLLGLAYARSRTSFAVLTNRRVLFIRGPWPRRVEGMRISEINAAHVRRSLLGRALGAGSLYLTPLDIHGQDSGGVAMDDLEAVEDFAAEIRKAVAAS